MKTQIATLLGSAVMVAGLAVGLTLGGMPDGIDAHQADADNYFVQHPAPAGGRTGIDHNDPYAPVDLSPAVGGSLRLGGVSAGATGDAADLDPCSPQRCKAW